MQYFKTLSDKKPILCKTLKINHSHTDSLPKLHGLELFEECTLVIKYS